MESPAVPANETARLLSLHQLQILDTHTERNFDRITSIARRVFQTDICLVSLVDRDRQWFKSRQGLDVEETPREISFCGHAILDDEVFVIEDARSDPQFVDNPLVLEEPNIRFYAGCPVRGPGGYRVGTLCVIDRKPRTFSHEQREMLRDMAGLVEDELAFSSQAIVDELTSLANRRGFNVVASHLLSFCRRAKSSAELIMFDLDGLKHINDSLGHDAGDVLLSRFAALLVKAFPTADVIARMGGDEFAVLLFAPESGSEEALRRLEQMAADAETIAEQRLSWSKGRATLDIRKHLTIDSLVKEADRRLYEDKASRCRIGIL